MRQQQRGDYDFFLVWFRASYLAVLFSLLLFFFSLYIVFLECMYVYVCIRSFDVNRLEMQNS